MKYILTLLATAFCTVLNAQTSTALQTQYMTKGETGWWQRFDDHTEHRFVADLSYLQKAKARGVNWLGATVMDDKFQLFTGRDDLFSFFRNLDLVLAFGFRVVVRFQPMAHVTGFMMVDRALAWQLYEPFAKRLAPYDPKRVGVEPLGEPALLSKIITVDGKGVVLALSTAEFKERIGPDTARLEDFQDWFITSWRKVDPSRTIILTPPGWAHLAPYTYDYDNNYAGLYEYDLLTRNWPNTIRAHDFYWGGGSPVPHLERAKAFYAKRGWKWMMLEGGFTGPVTERPAREKEWADWCILNMKPWAGWIGTAY